MVGRGGLLSVLGPLCQALAAPGSASREDSPLSLFPGQGWLSPHGACTCFCAPAGSHPPPHACVVLRMLSCVPQCALCRTGCFLETFPILSCSAALLSLQGILIGRHSGVLSLVRLKPNCRSLQVGGARFHERGPDLSRGLS